MQSIIIPGIIIGIVGGIILFFAAYNYYPHKNVNINLNGDCYEFLKIAYTKYKTLESAKEKELLRLQILAIEDHNVYIPIAFSGSKIQVDNLIESNQINVTDRQILGDNQTQVDKVIVKGLAKLNLLKDYYDNWKVNSTEEHLNQNVIKIGILPNKFISSDESKNIKDLTDKLMIKGIKAIIAGKDGVKSTECRSAIVYQER